MTIILCDIDNVLSNDEWRRGFINPDAADPRQRYHAYHSACELDSPANFHLLRPGARIILLTSMAQEYAEARERWLAAVKIRYELILYRRNDDHSPSVVVKRDMLLRLAALGYNLSQCIAAIDDQEEIVAMYRCNGLPGMRVAIYERP